MKNVRIINGVELEVQNIAEGIEYLFPVKVDGVDFIDWLFNNILWEAQNPTNKSDKEFYRYLIGAMRVYAIFEPEQELFETRHIKLSDCFCRHKGEWPAKKELWTELFEIRSGLRDQTPIERLKTLGSALKLDTRELFRRALLKEPDRKMNLSYYYSWQHMVFEEIDEILKELEKMGGRGTNLLKAMQFVVQQALKMQPETEPLVHFLMWDAQLVMCDILDYGLKEVFRRIYKDLTPVNRRMFALAFFRKFPVLGKPCSYPFNGRPLFMTSLATNFWDNLGEETEDLIIQVNLRRKKEHAKELKERYRGYLHLDKALIHEIRDREQIQKKKQRFLAYLKKQKMMLVSSEDLSYDEDVDILGSFIFEDIIEKRCTETEKRRLTRIRDGDTEEEIARDEGVSQEAVSKSIQSARRKIKQVIGGEV